MRNNQSSPLQSPRNQLIIILLSYIILALIFSYSHRYYINPDGITFLRLAGYIVEGNFQYSVTSHWGPLLSWLMAPLLFLGFDGIATGRILMFICGFALVFCTWLLTARFNLTGSIRFITMLSAALLVANWSRQAVTPDLPIAALFGYYFYFVTDSSLLEQKRIPIICGLIAGIAFLAKQFALPFFLVHFPLILLLRSYIDRDRGSLVFRRVLLPFLIGITVFFVMILPWILAMSSKYQQLTFGTLGSDTYAHSGPVETQEKAGLFKPRPETLHTLHKYEDVRDIADVGLKPWSPFDSRSAFMYRVKLALHNIKIIYSFLVFNYFIVGVLAVCFLPIIFLLCPVTPFKRFLYGWTLISFGVYFSGYVLGMSGFKIGYKLEGGRYIWTMIILILLLSFHFLDEMKNSLKTSESNTTAKWNKSLSTYVMVFFILSFTLSSGIDFLHSAKRLVNDNQINIYEKVANHMNVGQIPAPLAVIGDELTALYIAYYAKKQTLGSPLSTDLEGITNELREANAKSLMVFDNQEIVEKLKNDHRYDHKIAYENLVLPDNMKQTELNIFVLRSPD